MTRPPTNFWAIYEDVRRSEEYVDIPETLSRFAAARPDLPQERVEAIFGGIDFRSYLFPGSLEAIAHLTTIGLTVIVSDGDPVFQKRKIEQSGLWEAVGGRVLLTVHKQEEMETVFNAYPADQYVLIDDKTTIIADVAAQYASKVLTVLVCQGKYARLSASPHPDVVVPHIADLRLMNRDDFLMHSEAVPTAS